MEISKSSHRIEGAIYPLQRDFQCTNTVQGIKLPPGTAAMKQEVGLNVMLVIMIDNKTVRSDGVGRIMEDFTDGLQHNIRSKLGHAVEMFLGASLKTNFVAWFTGKRK